MRKLQFLMICVIAISLCIISSVSASDLKSDPSSISIDQGLASYNAIIAQNEINSSIAYSQANYYLSTFLASGAADKSWSGAIVNTEPTIIYDSKDRKLFYEFLIENKNKQVGTMKIFANKIFGQSLATIELQPRYYDPKSLTNKAISSVKNKFPKSDIISTSVVCYDYPLIGIKVKILNHETSKVQNIFADADSTQLIDEDSKTIWSLYNFINSVDNDGKISEWTTINDYIVSNQAAINNDLSSELRYAPLSYYKILSIGLHWQIYEYYCAPATGQMIAHYYNVQDTQEYIGSYMNTAPDHGTYIYDELNYYRNRLGKSQSALEPYPTWEMAKAEINENRPLAYHIGDPALGHVKVIGGWMTSTPNTKLLYIDDPSPLGTGRQYWENWGVIPQPPKAYIYVK